MEDPLIETWQIHDRINLYMLDAISEEDLGSTPSPKCKTVYDLFAHIHNVRLLWLKATAPELMHGLEKLETKTIGEKANLRAATRGLRRRDRAIVAKGPGRRGKDQEFQAARPGVPGIPDLARIPPSGSGGLGLETVRSPSR